jgi:cytosine/adenosine deaminase-related metal-dependent hydrolase
MASSLVRGRYVICRATGRDAAEIVRDGAVFQRDGVIEAIGPYEELRERYRADEVLGGPGSVVCPGFVNSHHHVGVTPFQLGAPDYSLELWIVRRLGTRRVDPYLDTLYSAFEMLRSGVTTVQHLHGHFLHDPATWERTTDDVLRAYRDVGMRVSYSAGIVDQNRLVADEERFLAGLDPGLREAVTALPGATPPPVEEQLRISYTDVVARWAGEAGGRVGVQLAPQNLHWCSDRALDALRECSQRSGANLHMHLVETPYQKEYARRRTGRSAVRYLHERGLLGPAMTLGHAVWVTEDDIDLIRQTGAMICNNASSNLRLRSGIAPVNRFLEHGVRVALGMDEAGINDDRDMLQEMRVALNVHREPGMHTAVPTPTQVFQMATENGARTTAFGERIGTLEPGRLADLVVLDWGQMSRPYLDADVSVVDALVHRGKPEGVRAVMVNGEVVCRDGRVTTVDEEAALAELSRRLAAPLDEDERRRLDLALELCPRVVDFFRDWLRDDRTPFYAVNSRA